jgi:hypothetical protein
LETGERYGFGPRFVKIGKAVLYPIDGLDGWDRLNTVMFRGSKLPLGSENDAA